MPSPMTFRPNDADMELIKKLQSRTGSTVNAEILRNALRAYDRELDALPAALSVMATKDPAKPVEAKRTSRFKR